MALGDDGTDDLDRAGGDDDPFAELRLDEDFVRAATRKEESGAERIERLRQIEQAHRHLEWQRAAAADPGRTLDRRERRRARLRTARTLVIVGVAAAVFAWVSYRDGGSEPVLRAEPEVGADQASQGPVDVGERPPPSPEEREASIGTPAAVPTGSGPFAFLAQQPGSANPVAYDPCRPIHLVVNGRTVSPPAAALLQQAVDDVSTASGLVMVIDGPTDEAPSPTREAYQPDRYAGRWAPVLVAWSDPTESPELAGDVAGRGGSQSLITSGGAVYVTGEVILDGPQIAEIMAAESDSAARMVMVHELGHLLGLDHVNDPTQVMNPEGMPGVDDLGIGDRLGLAQLGRGACFPEV